MAAARSLYSSMTFRRLSASHAQRPLLAHLRPNLLLRRHASPRPIVAFSCRRINAGTAITSSNKKEAMQTPFRSYRSYESVVQQNPNGFNGQSRLGFSGSVNGLYDGSVGQFQQNANDQHYLGNHYVSNDEKYQRHHSTSNHNSGNTGVSQENPNNIYMRNPSQQSPGNFLRGSTNTYQNPNGYVIENVGENLRNPSGSYNANAGNYPSKSNESSTYWNPNGYAVQNTGENLRNPSGSYNANAGNYPYKAFESHIGTMDAQVSNSFKAEGESGEAAESSQFNGTVEELDGLCKEGRLKEVVELLGLLERRHIPVDLPQYLMLMKACGEAKALQEAKYVHENLMRSVSVPQVSTYNKILEMYGKCGSMDDALIVFDKMPQRNLTSWDTMIIWLAKNGRGEDAIDLFTQFKEAGLEPDEQMFFGVFASCSAVGDMIEGMLHFESMSKDYGIIPSMEQYLGVVNMLGSAGYLDEALEFLEKLPVEPSVDVWESLMNHSRVYGNTELGDRCAELIEVMDPTRLNEQSKAGLIPVKASDLSYEKEKKKLASENLLAVRSRVHEYRAGDKSHPEADKIYSQLRGMKQQMKEAGYVPETRFVLHDIDQEGKEEALLAHSERLAVAYGLMSSPVRQQIRIIKNLRVCGDCHSALKIISKLVGRELIIRDAKRFHHFKDGLCSCRDYW